MLFLADSAAPPDFSPLAGIFISTPAKAAESMPTFFEISPEREYLIFADFSDIFVPSGSGSSNPSTDMEDIPASSF